MEADDHQIHQFAASVLGLNLAPLHAYFSPLSHVTKRPSQLFSGGSTPRSNVNIRHPTSKNPSLPAFKSHPHLRLRNKTMGPRRQLTARPVSTEMPGNSVFNLARWVMAAHSKADMESPPSFSAAEDAPLMEKKVKKTKEIRPMTMLRTRTLVTMTVVAPVVEGRTLKTTRARSGLKSIPEEGL